MLENQLFYFKLSVFGYDDDAIYELIGVDTPTGEYIKEKVKEVLGARFKTNSWDEIIKESFKCGLLEKYDYLNVLVKDQANSSTEKIFTELFMDEVSFYDSTIPIKEIILSFLDDCNLAFNKEED